MINQLRKKVIAINVLLACSILFLAIMFVFIIGYSRIDADKIGRLELAVDYDVDSADDTFSTDTLFRDIILIEYDISTGKILSDRCRFGSNVKITQEKLQQIAQDIDDGEYQTWWPLRASYRTKVEGNVLRIAIENVNTLRRTTSMYLFGAVAALLIGMMGLFVISILLSRVALKPVEESWTKQKQFVADASHELKTPLSVIMANTEIISSHKEDTVQSQIKWIENTRAEAERMAVLVNDLLFLAKNDDGLKVQMEKVNFSDCVGTIMLGYDAVFYENGKLFQSDITRDLFVYGNEGQLKQLATILLDNANKYAKGVGNIYLSLTAGKHVVLSVSNDSDPLTDEQKKHIFDRFYTLDTSRNKSKGGNGLGLSIAQSICKTHRGKISVDWQDGRTTFTVVIPTYKKKKDKKKNVK